MSAAVERGAQVALRGAVGARPEGGDLGDSKDNCSK